MAVFAEPGTCTDCQIHQLWAVSGSDTVWNNKHLV